MNGICDDPIVWLGEQESSDLQPVTPSIFCSTGFKSKHALNTATCYLHIIFLFSNRNEVVFKFAPFCGAFPTK